MTYHKSATADENVPGICKESWAWILNLIIVRKSKGMFKQLTERFCSGNVGDNELCIAEDTC